MVRGHIVEDVLHVFLLFKQIIDIDLLVCIVLYSGIKFTLVGGN